jgi:hypothetical protein
VVKLLRTDTTLDLSGQQSSSLEDFLGGRSDHFALMGSTSLLGFRTRVFLRATLKLVRTHLAVR